MDLIYNLLALVSISYCCWLGLRFAIGLTRQRSDAIDADEIDILLTHEADPTAAMLDEEHADDFTAWTDDLPAKARKLAEKLDGT